MTEKEESRSFKVNKALRYYGWCQWPIQENINNEIGKRKLDIAIEVLHEVYNEFPETIDLIEETLKQKYLK